MSMHLVRGVQVHGKSKIKKKPGWQKAQAEHNAFLKSMGIDPNKKPSKQKGAPLNETPKSPVSNSKTKPIPTSDVIPGSGVAKERTEYTGDYIVGIATMHKSNAVPVFNSEEAVEISSMRR